MQTTTTLRSDLLHRLETHGLTPHHAAQIADMLPPAGQHELVEWLRDSPDAVQEIRHTYRDHLADRLRTTTIAADDIRKLLATVTR